MKKLLLLFLLFTGIITAQETNDKIIYLDSLNKATNKENHYYYKIIKDYNLEKPQYKFLKHYKSGNLYQEGYTTSKDGTKLVGEIIFYHKNGNKQNSTFFEDGKPLGKVVKWYENGNKKEEGEFTEAEWSTGKSYRTLQFWDIENNHTVVDGNGDYQSDGEKGSIVNGYKDGVWTGQYEKEGLTYEESYQDGKFISGTTTDSDGNKVPYDVLEIKAEPHKGVNDFYKHIIRNFKQTKKSIKNNVRGKILVEFIVEKNGELSEIKIAQGLGYGLDEEALKTVSSYGAWKPAMQRGRKVRCAYTIPIQIMIQD